MKVTKKGAALVVTAGLIGFGVSAVTGKPVSQAAGVSPQAIICPAPTTSTSSVETPATSTQNSSETNTETNTTNTTTTTNSHVHNERGLVNVSDVVVKDVVDVNGNTVLSNILNNNTVDTDVSNVLNPVTNVTTSVLGSVTGLVKL